MTPALTLFLIIFLEGYVVLSAELLAMRLLIPFVGSGTDTISIIIAAVLMPLAFGYYAGGRFKTRHNGRHRSTVRQRLIRNLVIATAILTVGLSHVAVSIFFESLFLMAGLNDRIVLTAIYALLFLVYPVFLLGQTVPLISNYFPKNRLPVLTGKILFFSTLGSFMGAVFCTLVLMSFLGIHNSVIITIGCAVLLTFILSKKWACKETAFALTCLAAALWLNSPQAMTDRNVVANNAYHMVQITNYAGKRLMSINGNRSAGIDVAENRSHFKYLRYMEIVFIDPLIRAGGQPRDILVIGAGGFTVGLADKTNNYVFVDIDKELLKISEEHFLQQKLSDNKCFEAIPARAYLQQNDTKFDLIILDLFKGSSRTPEHLVTSEFFEQVKGALKPGGIMAGNYLLSPNFSDQFSINLDNTMRYVFKNINRYVIEPYDSWAMDGTWTNVIYSYHHYPESGHVVYTDNRNTSLFDKSTQVRCH